MDENAYIMYGNGLRTTGILFILYQNLLYVYICTQTYLKTFK